jgi:hypothetical protein
MRRLPRECRRVRGPAPVASYTAGAEQRGTPAAAEPLASLGQVYPDIALAGQSRAASMPATVRPFPAVTSRIIVHRQRGLLPQ